MTTYRIEGGTPLSGTIRAGGAKNAATKQILASLLADEEVVLHNVPNIGDVAITIEICRALGAEIEWSSQDTLHVRAANLRDVDVPVAFSGLNRIPILLFGPLLHRHGRAAVPLLGGDDIGARPIDFHLDALRRLGATVELDGQTWRAQAPRLKGALIDLPYPSVGATESALLSSCLAEGTTVIRNAAVEPEIMDSILLLQKMGALIAVEVDRTIVVEGVPRLHGAEHGMLADRIEVASFAAAAVATDGDVFIEGAEQATIMAFLNALRRVGGEFEVRPGLDVDRPRDRRAPRLRHRLAAAVRGAADPGQRIVGNPRDGLRTALWLYRRAARDGRHSRDLRSLPGRQALPLPLR